MRLKHGELILVNKELVLPVHYKQLLEMQGYLDSSLNFLKQCRKQGGNFNELKKSIEATIGRRFETSHFRQIYFLAPDFYNYKYEIVSASSTPMLFIDFKSEDVLNQAILDGRKQIFKQRLIELCKKHYDKFIIELKEQQKQH